MNRNTKKLEWEQTERGCWEVTSHAPNRKGYVKIIRNGIFYIAHRYIWIKTYGPIPEKLCVLHSCDNRKCINSEHLFLGTNEDNMNDMFKKGRGNREKGNKIFKEKKNGN